MAQSWVTPPSNGDTGHTVTHHRRIEKRTRGLRFDISADGGAVSGVDCTQIALDALDLLRGTNSPCVLYFPQGVWLIDDMLRFDHHIVPIGAGPDVTTIKLTNADSQLRVESLDGSSNVIAGGQAPIMGNFDLDGNDVANYPLYVGLCANRTIRRLHVADGVVDNVTFFATQNSRVDGMLTSGAGRDGIVIDGGAQDLSLEINSNQCGRYGGRVTMSAAHPTNASQLEPDFIRFRGGIFEQGSQTDAAFLVECGNVSFDGTIITRKYRGLQITKIQHPVTAGWLPTRVQVRGGRVSAKDSAQGDYAIECIGNASSTEAILLYLGSGVSLSLANIAGVRADIYTQVYREHVIVENSTPAFFQGHTAGVDDATVRETDRVTPVGGAVVIRKTADETVSNSTVLQDDDELSKTILSPGTYAFDGELYVDAVAAAGVKLLFTATGGGNDIQWSADVSPVSPNASALTDGTTGAANTTLQALPSPADTPADADALRDDIENNLMGPLRNNFADLALAVNNLILDVALRQQTVKGDGSTNAGSLGRGAGTVFAIPFRGTAKFTGIPSTPLKLRWAQVSGNVTGTIIKAGSWLRIQRAGAVKIS